MRTRFAKFVSENLDSDFILQRISHFIQAKVYYFAADGVDDVDDVVFRLETSTESLDDYDKL